jgi:hypothetical protein
LTITADELERRINQLETSVSFKHFDELDRKFNYAESWLQQNYRNIYARDAELEERIKALEERKYVSYVGEIEDLGRRVRLVEEWTQNHLEHNTHKRVVIDKKLWDQIKCEVEDLSQLSDTHVTAKLERLIEEADNK